MWILPTLNRPKQCQEVLDSMARGFCTTSGVVFVNGHSHKEEYKKLYIPKNWEMVIHPDNLGALGALNWCFKNYHAQKFYGFIGDDEFVSTPGWDRKLTDQAGDWMVSHGNDNWQSGQRIHGYVCIGGKLAQSVGYLAIPECWHWYGFDSMWEVIAKGLGLQRFCPDVYLEHRHFLNGKSEKDVCYELGESKKEHDFRVWNNWLEKRGPHVMERVMRDMARSGGK